VITSAPPGLCGYIPASTYSGSTTFRLIRSDVSGNCVSSLYRTNILLFLVSPWGEFPGPDMQRVSYSRVGFTDVGPQTGRGWLQSAGGMAPDLEGVLGDFAPADAMPPRLPIRSAIGPEPLCVLVF
jgi:hypothetical protein